jgi:hypothetical protein
LRFNFFAYDKRERVGLRVVFELLGVKRHRVNFNTKHGAPSRSPFEGMPRRAGKGTGVSGISLGAAQRFSPVTPP